MQTEYQHSDHQPNQSQYLTPVHSVATSELSPALEAGSKVAMILVLLGTIFGSLSASRDVTTVSEAEIIESVATTPIEESPVVVEPVSSTSETETTPIEPVATTSSLESTVETASPTTETTDSTLSSTPTTATTDTTDSQASAVDLTQPETTTTTETTDSEISTSSETPETTATTDPMLSDSEVASDTTDATASVSVEQTTPTPTTAETQTASNTISATEIEKLNQILYNKIDKTWTVPVNGESVYTVQVSEDGSITGYEPTSQVATNNAQNTPLPSLVQSNGSSETLTKEPYAEFEVIFTPTGLLEVKNSTQSDSN